MLAMLLLLIASATLFPLDGVRFATIPVTDVASESSAENSTDDLGAEKIQKALVASLGMDAAQASLKAIELAKKRVQPESIVALYNMLRNNLNGLGYGPAEGAQHAMRLAIKRVDPSELTKIYQVLKRTNGGFGMRPENARMKAMDLVHKKVDPAKLQGLYYALRDVGFDFNEAKQAVWDLCTTDVDLGALKAIYKSLTDASKLAMPAAEARRYVVWLTLAGSVPEMLVNAYRDGLKSGSSATQRTVARDRALFASIGGRPWMKRYTPTLDLCTAEEFLEQYGAAWLREWTKSPLEMRVAPCHEAYSAVQFEKKYGDEWRSVWNRSQKAKQRRVPSDDFRPYTMPEFLRHYGSDWRDEWLAGVEAPCIQCAFKAKRVGRRAAEAEEAEAAEAAEEAEMAEAAEEAEDWKSKQYGGSYKYSKGSDTSGWWQGSSNWGSSSWKSWEKPRARDSRWHSSQDAWSQEGEWSKSSRWQGSPRAELWWQGSSD